MHVEKDIGEDFDWQILYKEANRHCIGAMLFPYVKKAGCPERAELDFQKSVINSDLPFTIGGGIGQSRICMFFLRKAHIGEVQSSLWPDEMSKKCKDAGIILL